MTPQPTTADALLQIGISPNVPDANMEPANLVDAIAQIGNALRYSAKWLGNGDAGTPMGALEATRRGNHRRRRPDSIGPGRHCRGHRPGRRGRRPTPHYAITSQGRPS